MARPKRDRYFAVPVVAAIPKPSRRSRLATTSPAGLSASANDKNTVPSVGNTVPAANSAL